MIESRETPKVVVGGIQRGSALDRHCGQMYICRQVTASAGCMEQMAENRPMPQAGPDRLHERLIEPGTDKIRSLFHGKRIGEYARTGRDSQERQQTRPWQSNSLLTGERLLKPLSGGFVAGSIPVDGVDQQVGVNEYHLRC